ncbi:MAG: glycosyltransferase [Magnetococcales bacterium]|nr:glycosyltransferase [Magnetococcales bacterium]
MTAANLPKILFATPRFLFPTDTGGQIRSAKILHAAHGKLLDVTLVSPATPRQVETYRRELDQVCSRFIPYPCRWSNPLLRALGRSLSLFGSLPVSVAADISPELQQLLARLRLPGDLHAEVCDFLHLAINYTTFPKTMPTILFTHNVEQEIFRRRLEVSRHWWQRRLWQDQYHKMQHLESILIPRFTRILTVSDRDRHFFAHSCRHPDIRTIPTGVDFDRLPWQPPAETREVVFMGSMDAHQNIEGIQWFLEEIWPLLNRKVANPRLKIIGRHPPPSLVAARKQDEKITFTGWVADIVSACRSGQVLAVPLRVGSGTRIKIYEAMALGLPVVSTAVGAEGLDLIPGTHYLQADQPQDFAAALASLLDNRNLGLELSRRARSQVETCCGWSRAAQVLAAACLDPVIPT